jgi:hypothetical protein
METVPMRKSLTALALAVILTITAAGVPRPAQAHDNGRVAAGIIGGFAAGALIGSLASRPYYYGYYGDRYGYFPGYYGPRYRYYGPRYYYYDGPRYYAPRYRYYEEPVYVRPRYYRGGSCWIETDSVRGYGYYGPCE